MKRTFQSLLFSAATLGSAGGAFAQSAPLPYGEPIASAKATQVIAAAEAESCKNGWAMSIAIVGPAGNLLHLHRMDNSNGSSTDVAISKARSAALFRRPTKVFQDLLAQGAALTYLLALEGAVPVQGGIPLVVDNKIVGAVGISGGSGADDSAVAEAAARAMSAR